MFYDDDEEEAIGTIGSDELDDFEDYVDFISALEEEEISKNFIVNELMNEFDLSKNEAIKILKRYLEEKSDYLDDDDYEDSVDDDDYGDGNSE